MKKQYLILFLFMLGFCLSFSIKTHAAKYNLIRETESGYFESSVDSGKTQTLKLYDNNYKKCKLKGTYTWSIVKNYKNAVKMKSKKHDKNIKLYSSFNWLTLRNQSFKFFDYPSIKVKCVIKNKKKTVLNKTFTVVLSPQFEVYTHLILDGSYSTVKAPSEDFFTDGCWDNYKINGKVQKKYTTDIYPFRLIKSTPSWKTKAKAYKILLKKENTKYNLPTLDSSNPASLCFITRYKETDHDFYIANRKWYRVCAGDGYRGDALCFFKNQGNKTSVKKGQTIYIYCGSVKGTTFSIIQGEKLLHTEDKKKEGYLFHYTKKNDKVTSDSNAYMTYGAYSADKTGTVKIKFSYPDKTSHVYTLKIKK